MAADALSPPAGLPVAAPDDDDALAAGPVAALLGDGQADLDALLSHAARLATAAGLRVRGLLMTYPGGRHDGCAHDMVLVDLHRGDEYRVSQPMGRDTRACRADPQGFARASGVLREALRERAELVICNRFGVLEAEGEGFAEELLALLAEGVPLLTAVSPRHHAAWQRFTGGAALLAPTTAAVEDWLRQPLSLALPPAAGGV